MDTLPPLPAENKVRTLKKVFALQLGMLCAILYGALGLIASLFFLLVTLLGASLSGSNGAREPLPFIFSIGLTIMMPIFYAAVGFVIGVIGALVYNLAAKVVGGIKVEVE